MLHSLAQGGECLGNMLLHGVGTDAQPVGCLLIGEMLKIAEAEYRAGGFLQLPRYLLRLLQQRSCSSYRVLISYRVASISASTLVCSTCWCLSQLRQAFLTDV